MKKIRFVNPVKECMSIQGKPYTVGVIATIVGSLALSVIAAMCKMPVEAIVAAMLGVGSAIFFGWWFGTGRSYK